jgi:hypothetical protein
MDSTQVAVTLVGALLVAAILVFFFGPKTRRGR